MRFLHLSKVGVEIEGAWIRRPKITKVCNVVGDGSVHINGPGWGWVGEISSAPLASLSGLLAFMRKRWPNKTNHTCGLHVHISTKQPNAYALLARPDFVARFNKWAGDWSDAHPDEELFSVRQIGGNSFCKKMPDPNSVLGRRDLDALIRAQARYHGKTDARYRQLNFCYAFHGTLEARIFPAFESPEVAVDAVKSYLFMVEHYLRRHAEEIALQVDEALEAAGPIGDQVLEQIGASTPEAPQETDKPAIFL